MSTNYVHKIKDSNNVEHDIAESIDTRVFTGHCETGTINPIKEVVLDNPVNFEIKDGAKILITFKYADPFFLHSPYGLVLFHEHLA